MSLTQAFQSVLDVIQCTTGNCVPQPLGAMISPRAHVDVAMIQIEKTKFTGLDPSNPDLSWCPANCGQCYRLCSTGGTTTSGKPAAPGKCIVVQVENRCGDGYHQPGEAQWCRQEMSWWECKNSPSACSAMNATNDYGYPAHFDLQDANLQITNMGWDNPEVTFEQVSCSQGDFGNWQQSYYCQQRMLMTDLEWNNLTQIDSME